MLIMKLPNKRELQQVVVNHSSDNDFKDLLNPYKKCTVNSYLFLVNTTTLVSDNSSCFQHNLLKRIKQLLMTILQKIRDEKL